MRKRQPNVRRVSRRQFLARSGLVLGGAIGLRISHTAAYGATQRSGRIVAAVSERMLVLDPADHYSISTTSVLRHVFDPLIDVTNDHKFIPALAESWEASDNTTWRITLRKGVTFHDGTPFNADSVLYTLRRVRDNSKLIKAFVYQDLDAVEKDGEYGVKLTTKRPFGSLPAHLTMLGMLPPSAAGNEERFFQKPVGTGPFQFAGWTRGEVVNLAANPHYWKSATPKVARASFRFIPELSTRAAGLRAGEFHVIDRVPPDMAQTLKASPGVKVQSLLGLEVQQWLFQLAKAPNDNLQLRRAISLGIDRSAIIKDLLLSTARPAVCPIPPGLMGHVNLGVKPYNPEKAKALLREAGYQGQPLEFVLMKDLYPKQLEIAQAVESMLRDIGVRIEIRNLEIATARQLRSAGKYDMFFSGWAHLPHDPDWYFGQWFTKAGAAGLSRYYNPKVEQLIAEARLPDPRVRAQRYEELQRILWTEEEPTIWPYYSQAIYGIRDTVHGYEARSDYYVLLSDVSVS